jgi:hypothetical protein
MASREHIRSCTRAGIAGIIALLLVFPPLCGCLQLNRKNCTEGSVAAPDTLPRMLTGAGFAVEYSLADNGMITVLARKGMTADNCCNTQSCLYPSILIF